MTELVRFGSNSILKVRFWDTLYKGVSAKDDFEIQTRRDFYAEAFTFQRLLAYYLAFSASSY